METASSPASGTLIHCSLGDDETSKQNNGGNSLCHVCDANAAKYKCPKCLIRTCSLTCVKSHKVSADCDGVRCKTAFIPMSTYNENNMLSDYRLLEEVARSCHNSERKLKDLSPAWSKWTTIQRNAAKQMKINLMLAPLSFTMHKENTTKYLRRSKSFVWHLEWHFLPIDMKVQKKAISDTTTLSEAIKETSKEFIYSKPEIVPYFEVGNIAIFMRRCDYPSHVEKYHSIDVNLPIKEALIGKTILEYPRFLIVLNQDAGPYVDKVCEEVSPHASMSRPSVHDRRPGGGRGHRRNTFKRFKNNGKPYQKSQPSHNSDRPPSSFHDHIASDTFP